jgi:predicted transcriptional regulator
MPRSKLEKYVEILAVLVPTPLEFETVSLETKIECNTLERYFKFLIAHKLVEKRSLAKNPPVYAITERGLAVFKTLQAQRYLEKIRNILPVMDEADRVGPLLSKTKRRFDEESQPPPTQ